MGKLLPPQYTEIIKAKRTDLLATLYNSKAQNIIVFPVSEGTISMKDFFNEIKLLKGLEKTVMHIVPISAYKGNTYELFLKTALQKEWKKGVARSKRNISVFRIQYVNTQGEKTYLPPEVAEYIRSFLPS